SCVIGQAANLSHRRWNHRADVHIRLRTAAAVSPDRQVSSADLRHLKDRSGSARARHLDKMRWREPDTRAGATARQRAVTAISGCWRRAAFAQAPQQKLARDAPLTPEQI